MGRGIELWRGPSQLTGEPVVLIATAGSKNAKTGDMIQTWILSQHYHPAEAAKGGQHDEMICGGCPLRGSQETTRRCYVNVTFAPAAIWNAWKRRSYGAYLLPNAWIGKALRVGAYGDPAAVPLDVWLSLFVHLKPKKWTGYTHQWETCPEGFATFCMASVETAEQAVRAQPKGYRTFRTGWEGLPGETHCPASVEMGHRSTCEKCGLCNGMRGVMDKRGSIFIHPHGSTAKRFLTGDVGGGRLGSHHATQTPNPSSLVSPLR